MTIDDIIVTRPEALDQHLNRLIIEPESENLYFSIYLDLSQPSLMPAQVRGIFGKIEPGLDEEGLQDLFDAERLVLDLVGSKVGNEFKGLAFHYRAGVNPKAFVIAFHLPIKPWATADHFPNVVPLIELRDTYDRYVVLISTNDQARILEIVLGSVTREAWLKHPDLRQRVGREWTREHYQNHRHHRDHRFLREKIEVLRRLMNQKGYGHLILAGSRHRVAALEKELPEDLRRRVVDICNLSVHEAHGEVVRKTIESFVQQEAYESRVNLDRLKETLLKGGGAVVGLDACEATLRAGVVDTLVVASPDTSEVSHGYRAHAHRSRSGELKTVDRRRTQLLHDAVALGIPIEFVEPKSFLDDYAGVGAILRYRGAEHVAVGVGLTSQSA